jgi:succinyl-CoA synthetase alpha subunit
VIYVPPPFAADAILEAPDAGIELIVCITEGIPVLDMVRVRRCSRASEVALIGPNCPGVITPGRVQDRHHAGLHPQAGPHRRGVALGHADLRGGRAAHALGIGQSTCVGIGGDPVNGTTSSTCCAVQRRPGHRRRRS